MRRLLGWLAIACLFVVVPSAHAQRQASVGGTVVDEQGEKLEGVTITVSSESESRTDTTNKKGRFRIMVMDATYPFTVRVEKEGYVTLEGPLELGVGEAASRNWTLVKQQPLDEAPGEVEGTSESVLKYNEGASAFNAGDYAAARESFEGALEIDPEMLAARKVLTLVYFQQQEWDLAAATAETVSAAEPDNTAALKIGFDSASRLGQTERALAFLDKLVAVSTDPETAARVFNQGVSELRAGAVEEAKKRFNQAIEIDPTLGAAYSGLATLHLQSEEFDEALAMADRLLEIDPGNAEALGIRYEAYRLMGDETQMQAALEQLQGSDPDRIVEAFFKQGVLMFNQGNPEAAIEAFQRVISADPEHARAHYELGRSYLSAGDMANAKASLETFLEMAPGDPEAPSAQEMLSYLE